MIKIIIFISIFLITRKLIIQKLSKKLLEELKEKRY